jgi:hypothetical protein
MNSIGVEALNRPSGYCQNQVVQSKDIVGKFGAILANFCASGNSFEGINHYQV